jgi:hypothetical protein
VGASVGDSVRLSGWRIAFYGFALLWMLLQPTFVRESSHFGWGFFPRMASLVLVPVILVALGGDVLLRLVDACSGKVDAVAIRLIRISIPALLLAGSIYWLSTQPGAFSDYVE